MNKDTLKRLKGLEARQRAARQPPSLSPYHYLQVCTLAVLAGGAAGSESVAEGHARALGYASPRDLQSALHGKAHGKTGEPDDYNARWTRALSDLASANDLCPETASGMDFVELAARLLPLAPDSNARRQALKVLEEAGPGFWGENDD